MIRRIVSLLSVIAITTAAVRADHVIVSGGPALRVWEDLRVQEDRHDRWWANFIRGATVLMDIEKKNPEREQTVIWLVYKPGYADRGNEDGKPYTTWIPELAQKRGVQLVWFSSGSEFKQIINSRPRGSIRKFDYFGHSNKHAFMFEYGSDIIAASTAWLHENDLRDIRASVFSRDAVCTSWGCHTGESMSTIWRRELGVPLRGVRGPTNYTSVGMGKLPEAKGRWSEG